MNKLKLLLIALFTFHCSTNIAATDWTKLIGQNIIISDDDATIAPYVYCAESLNKKNFNKKLIDPIAIVGKPLLVSDVFIKDDKDKSKRSVNIVFIDEDSVKHVFHALCSCDYPQTLKLFTGGTLLKINGKLVNVYSPSSLAIRYSILPSSNANSESKSISKAKHQEMDNLFSSQTFDVCELVDKDIIIPHTGSKMKSDIGSVYNSDAIVNFKFKEEYLYKNNIFNKPIHISKVETINQGKKDEAVVISAIYNTDHIAIYIPFRYSTSKIPYAARWFLHIDKEVGWSKVSGTSSQRFLNIPYIDIALVNKIDAYFKNSTVYPIKTCFGIHPTRRDYNSYKGQNHLLLGKSYEYLGVEYDSSELYNGVLTFSVHLKDVDGNIKEFPIRCSTIEGNGVDFIYSNYSNYPTLTNIYEFFEKEDDHVNNSLSRIDCALVDSISKYFKNKEIYFNGVLRTKQSDNDILLQTTIDMSPSLHHPDYCCEVPKGYYTLTDIKLLPSDVERPYLWYYAFLSKDTKLFAIPIDKKFAASITLAEEHKAAIAQQEAYELQKQKEQEKKYAQEDAEYYQSLVRKYGKANAKLISNGEVKIGFTKAMCEEAWGSPFDISTVTTAYGSTEAWWYGGGNFLYFRSGKLVMIFN